MPIVTPRFLDDLDSILPQIIGPSPAAAASPPTPSPADPAFAPPPSPFARIGAPPSSAAAMLSQIEPEMPADPAPDVPPPLPKPAMAGAPAPRGPMQRVQVESDTLEFPADMDDASIEQAIHEAYPHLNPNNARGVVSQMGRSVATGTIGSVGTGLKSAGIIGQAPQRNATEVGTLVEQYATADPQTRAAMRQRVQAMPGAMRLSALSQFSDIDEGEAAPPVPPAPRATESTLYQAGEAVQKFGERTFPVSPEDKQRWYNQLSNAVGSSVPLIGTALIPGAGPAISFTSAAMMGAGEAAERAIDAGATEDEIVRATYMGLGPGAIDYLAIDRLLRPITRNPGVRGFLVGAAEKMLEQAGVEGSTEAVQQVLQNWIAKGIYKPGQELTEDVLHNFLLGAGAGGLFGGGAAPFNRVRSPAAAPGAAPAAAAPGVPPTGAVPTPAAPAPPGALPPPALALPAPETVYGDGFTMEEPGPEQLQLPAPETIYGEGFTAGAPPVEPPDPQVAAAAAAKDLADVLAAPEPTVAAVRERQAGTAAADAGLPPTGATVRFTTPDLAGNEQTAKVHSYTRAPGQPDRVVLVDDRGDEVFEGPWADLEIRSIDGKGTKAEPVKVVEARDVDAAAEQVAEPTPGQAQAGNYRKGHLKWQGLDIAIETPKGGTRTAKDGSWEVPNFPANYGYIKRTEAKDGDQVDIYLGDRVESPRVYVIDQIDPATGKYDEAKVVLGTASPQEARAIYEAAFPDGSGPSRIGAISTMSLTQFKAWLKGGDAKKPLAYKAPARDKQVPASSPASAGTVATAAPQPSPPTAPPAKPKRRPPVRRDDNIAHWLSRRGGMYDPGGDLASMGADAWHRRMPGFGRLIRAGGTAEQASMAGVSRETRFQPDIVASEAVQEGLLPDGAGPRELLDALREAIAGRPGGQDVTSREDAEKRREQDRADAINKAYAEVQKLNTEQTWGLNQSEMETAAIMAVDENMPIGDAAIEAAGQNAIAWADDQAEYEGADEREFAPAEEPEAAPDTRAVDGGGGPRAEDRVEAPGPAAKEARDVPGEPPRKDAEEAPVVVDRTDQGEQRVLPGAERISDRELAERRMRGAKQAPRGQKPADDGLFDVAGRSQEDMKFDVADTATLLARLDNAQRTVLEAFTDDLRQRLDAMGLTDVNLTVATKPISEDPKLMIRGLYFPGVNRIVVAALSGAHHTLNHEAVHAMRGMGLFTPAEWAALEKAARADAARMADVTRRYRNLSEPDLVEEAIADMFADWSYERTKAGGLVQRAFNKIKRFLDVVRELVTGNPSYRQAFEKMASGEIGERPRRGGASNEVKMSLDRPVRDFLGMGVSPFDRAALDYLHDRRLPRLARLSGLGKGAWDEILRSAQNYFLPTLRTQQAIEKKTGQPLPQSMDVSLQEELHYDRTKKRLEDFEEKREKPLLDKIEEHGLTLDEVDGFLEARHAPERNALIAEKNKDMPDAGSGITTAAARERLEGYKAEGKLGKLNEIAKMVDAINKARLDLLVESGLLSEAQRTAWEKTYRFYVPLRGERQSADLDAQTGEVGRTGSLNPRTGQGFDIRGKESKEAMGRGLGNLAESPLAMTLLQYSEAVIRAEKNRVGQSFLDLAQAFPDPDLWEVNRQAYKRRRNKATGLIEWYADNADRVLNPNVLAVKRDGQVYWIEIKHERLAAAMKKLGPESSSRTVQLLGWWTRLHAATVTRWNPAFFIPNLMRDLIEASINVQQYGVPGMARKIWRDVGPAIRGAMGGIHGKEATDWQRWYHEFRRAGGGISLIELQDVEAKKRALLKQLKRMGPGKWATTQRNAIEFGKLVGSINDSIENGVRLATYKNLREAGIDEQHAASIAKNISVNFNRRGASAWIGSLYLFFNAGVQGIATVGRALRNKRVQQVAGGLVAMGFVQEMMNAALGGDDEKDKTPMYDKLGDFEKQRNLLIANPWATGKDDLLAVRLPMSRSYAPFWYMGVTLGEVIRGKTSPAKAAVNMVTAFIDAYSPIGTAPNLLTWVSPEVLKPAAELYSNVNFAGNPIMPPKEKIGGGERPESERYFKSVAPHWRELSRLLSEATGGNSIMADSAAIDISPEVFEHLFGWVTGGVGRFVQDLTKAGANVPEIVSGETRAIATIPIVKGFLSVEREGWARTEYYGIRDRARAAHEAIRAYQKIATDEAKPAGARASARKEVDKIKADFTIELDMRRRLEGETKVNARDRRALDVVENDKSLTDAQRREVKRRLDMAIEDRMRKTIAAHRAAKERRETQGAASRAAPSMSAR